MCKGRRRKHRDAPYVSSTWYNALGLPTQMALSDTIVTRWGYFGLGGEWDSHPALGWDNFGRLESLRTSAPSLAPLLDLRYDYDAAGNVTRWANFRYQVGNWPAASSIADSFDVSSTVTFTYSSRQTVPYNDGGQNVCQSSGTGVDLSAQFYRTAYSLNTGDALRLRFKVDQDDTATRLAIETSPSGTYRRLGVVAYGGKLYVQTVEGSTTRYPADLLLDLQTNTWYTLSIVLDDQAGFYLEACQESDPSVRGSYHTPMPAGQSWRFHHWIQNGNCYLDDYREYTDTSGLDWSPKEWLALGYDSLHRLTGTGALSPWQGYTATYAYNPIGNLTESNESGVSWSYTYPDSGLGSVRPHAASSLSNGYTYQYDGNGNLVTRTLGSDTYALQYDLEGRVVEVKKNTVLTITFVYVGDGRQVKSTVNGMTHTVYIGNYYEKEGDTVRTYYHHAGKRVAMREDGTLYWLLTDHPSLTLRASLGSTAMVLTATGAMTAERGYYPYGETRYTSGSTPTRYRFTGQREEASLGLYFYNARWYDAELRRFVQADTLVPQPGNPQSLNRYSYVLNNPLKYVDPSGHAIFMDTEAEVLVHPVTGRWMPRSSLRRAQRSVLNEFAYLDDVEGSATLWELTYAATLGSGPEVADNISTLVTGAGGGDTLLEAFLLKGKEYLTGKSLNLPDLGDTGFHPDYRDWQNQPYHFWSYVNTTAQNGAMGFLVGTHANAFHEMFDPTEAIKQPQDRGTSWEDYFLSFKGMEMGYLLYTDALSPDRAGAWIRRELSSPAGPAYDMYRGSGTSWWPSVWIQKAVDWCRLR